MGKKNVPLNPGLTFFEGGVWMISLHSRFISGHNLLRQFRGGRGVGVTTFGGSLLSKVYGMTKWRPSFAIYRFCFQSYLFSL